MNKTIYSKILPGLISVVCFVAFTACSHDENEPYMEDDFSTEYVFEAEFSEDIFKTADVKAYIRTPQGSVNEEKINKTSNKWILKGNSIPDKAGIMFEFDLKEGNYTGEYEIGYNVNTTVSFLNRDMVISYKSQGADDTFTVEASDLIAFYGTSLLLGGKVNARGEAFVTDGYDIDFGINGPDRPAFGEADPFNGHTAVLMREASDDNPALYFADCNVGAWSPGEEGYYFWWGDINGYFSGNYFDFTFDNAEVVTYKKTIQQLYDEGYITTNDPDSAVLKPEYDAAAKNFGGKWRMPTEKEWIWLKNSCTWTWCSDPGYVGYKVKSNTTGGEIFLPASGYIFGNSIEKYGFYGSYWSANPFANVDGSFNLYFNSDDIVSSNVSNRFFGVQIRPVAEL